MQAVSHTHKAHPIYNKYTESIYPLNQYRKDTEKMKTLL